MKYPVVIHKDENSDYGVTFPDLPGCFSAVCLFMTAFLPQHGASFICETVFQPSVTSYSAHLLWPSAGF